MSLFSQSEINDAREQLSNIQKGSEGLHFLKKMVKT